MSDWLDLLRAEVARANITDVAARLKQRNGKSFSRPAISRVLSGSYGDTAGIEAAVLEAFSSADCPHLGREIPLTECRSMAERTDPPRQTRAQLAHWRACQHCPNRPAAGRGEE
ncbi:MAG TPA: hypothetical protein PKC59_04430 [Burkholderiaceae bacterium]|nr:hypothetical protein [Burkholderiaceae bacterium]